LAVMKRSRKPLSCKEMIEAMATAQLWTYPGGKTPDATLYATILHDMRKGQRTARRNFACSGDYGIRSRRESFDRRNCRS
jgi:hypothetical protein